MRSITEYWYHSRHNYNERERERELELVVPDHQEGVVVVHLSQVRGAVSLHGGCPPLYVAPASHQGRHGPLDGLRLAGRPALAGDVPPHARLGVGDEGGVPGEGGRGEVGAGV